MVTATEARPVIKVAALSGSLRKASYNEGLIRAAIELTKESISEMEIEHLNLCELPMQNLDLEGEDGSFPPAVEAFRQKVLEADCFLFASPEFNYSVSGEEEEVAADVPFEGELGADEPEGQEFEEEFQ